MLVPIDPNLVQHFNRSLMRLLRPSSTRDNTYVTDLYCGVIQHPTDQTAWPLLDLPDNHTVLVHIDSDGAELKQMLDVFVEKKALTIDESEGLKTSIRRLRGQQVRIVDMIPQSWQPYILTREQAKQAGYY